MIVPRKTTADDIYEGYHIPSGAMIVANSWYVSFTSCITMDILRRGAGLSYMMRRRIQTRMSFIPLDTSQLTVSSTQTRLTLQRRLSVMGAGYAPAVS